MTWPCSQHLRDPGKFSSKMGSLHLLQDLKVQLLCQINHESKELMIERLVKSTSNQLPLLILSLRKEQLHNKFPEGVVLKFKTIGKYRG